MREEQLRIRVTPKELEIIKTFIKNGKNEKLWTNNRTALFTLIEYWNNNHIKGKFFDPK